VTLRALSLGAADYVPKPETARDPAADAFHRDLIEKIRSLGRRRQTLRRPPALGPTQGADALLRWRQPPATPSTCPSSDDPHAYRLRPFASVMPRALLIGSSTGGPQALARVIEKLPAAIDHAPVLITQHMPPTFTTVLAEHLTRVGGRGAHEAEHGEMVLAGGIYVAPGGRHMRVVRCLEGVTIALGDDPPINYCKPAVDPLFASAASVWGPATLAVVLTGMGCDGTRGAADVVAAGGSVIAQDEATSVVWGMPRSVAQAGLCASVLPLNDIAPKILRLFSGDRS
jgi:two-component system chemotaxis response regulator CheB